MHKRWHLDAQRLTKPLDARQRPAAYRTGSDMNQTNLQNKSLLVLLVLVTVAFIWILLPFYGAVFWAVILGIVFAPLQRRLQLKFGWPRNLTSLCTLGICLVIAILPVIITSVLLVRWKQEGSVPPQAPAKPGEPAQSARNFLGFRDGSANPNSNDAKAMDQIVWVQPGSDEPAWAANGSYQAVRIIRNFVERWDRTPLQEQESIIGRIKPTGAPMDGDKETQVPDYSKDPEGKLTKLDAHIRLANPRTPQTQANLILRRPFNYSNGVNKNGQLDMGLLFICYQADLEKGFISVQTRLNGEPLEEYLKPVGGGYFFTLPGVTGPKDFLGRTLLAATHSQTTANT